jgi:hypothetical protein
VNAPRRAGAVFALLIPCVLAAQPGGVVPLSAVTPNALWLSDTARLTLTVEGPAPLRVEPPDRAELLLDGQSRLLWKIDRPGLPEVTDLGGGRERWARSYRLSPFVPGKAVAVAFAPVTVRAGGAAAAQEVVFPAVAVEVKTSVTQATADGVQVRGIEELPPVTPPQPEAVGWQVVAGLAGVFAVGLVVGLVRRWRAKPPAPPPGVWAWAELGRAAAEPAGPATERVATALRGYVARRFGVPAPHLTTAELAAAPWPDGFPPEPVAALGDILAACDRAKFTADPPSAEAAAALVGLARHWVSAAEARATS